MPVRARPRAPASSSPRRAVQTTQPLEKSRRDLVSGESPALRHEPAREGEYLPGRRLRRRVGSTKPNGIHRLTDATIRDAEPRDKPYVLSDGASLYVEVKPNGSKLWKWDFRLPGAKNDQPYSIGPWPHVSIDTARLDADEARAWVRQGLNPTTQRKIKRATNAATQALDFASVAAEWEAGKKKVWSKRHANAQHRLLVRFLLPGLGALPIGDIQTPHVLATLQAIERRGAHELLPKSRVICLRHAIATGRRASDPTLALAGAFTRPPVVNRPTVSDAEFPALFKALAEVPAELTTKLALYFQIATWVRPGEVRFAEWGEIDRAKKLWRIAAARMKTRVPFVQPLSPLAMTILERAAELRQTHTPDELIFPGFTKSGHLSENAFTALLARAGHYGRQGGVAGAYDRGEYIPARRRILGHWADQCTAWGMRLP